MILKTGDMTLAVKPAIASACLGYDNARSRGRRDRASTAFKRRRTHSSPAAEVDADAVTGLAAAAARRGVTARYYVRFGFSGAASAVVGAYEFEAIGADEYRFQVTVTLEP